MRKSPLRSGREDISAYVDDALEGDQQARVANEIAKDAELTALATAYEEQSASLRRIRSDMLLEPIPSRLLETVRNAHNRRRRRWWVAAAAAVVAAACVGAGAGWWGNVYWQGRKLVLHDYIADAVMRHAEINAAGLVEPELGTGRDFLAGVAAPFDIPARWSALRDLDLTPYAFRTVKQQDVMAGLLYYRDSKGRTVSLYVRTYAGREQSRFKQTTLEGQAVVYWLDGWLAYVVVGDLPGERIAEIGRAIYASRTMPLSAVNPAGGSKAGLGTSEN